MAVCGGTCEPASSPSLGRGSVTPSPDGALPHGKEMSSAETPRKNKRKLSSPRKRADFSIKRLCPETSPGSVMSDSGCSEDFEGVREEPPDTPDTAYLPEPDDSSQQGLGEGGIATRYMPITNIMNGMRTNCVVPSMYLNKTHYSIPPTALIPGYSALKLPTAFPDGVAAHHHHEVELMGRTSVHGFENQDQDDGEDYGSGKGSSRKQRKNYKNMTRERRVEANARERSRVHTISAAFDALRQAVPSYSYNQKLSKLAILRIASSYIMALARLADMDYSQEQNSWSFSECVDMCTRTIQTEGRARRRH